MPARFAAGLTLALLLALAAACGDGDPRRTEVRIGGLVVQAELALTPDERSLGLGGRESLAPDAGMLFVYPDEQPRTFWMKDTRVPLDFVWISADRRVIGFVENVPPPAPGTPDSDLPLYSSPAPVPYVLEVNAGAVARAGVQVGDAVTFEADVSMGAIAGR